MVSQRTLFMSDCIPLRIDLAREMLSVQWPRRGGHVAPAHLSYYLLEVLFSGL